MSLMDADSSIRIEMNGVRRRGMEKMADIAFFQDRRTQRGGSLDDSREITVDSIYSRANGPGSVEFHSNSLFLFEVDGDARNPRPACRKALDPSNTASDLPLVQAENGIDGSNTVACRFCQRVPMIGTRGWWIRHSPPLKRMPHFQSSSRVVRQSRCTIPSSSARVCTNEFNSLAESHRCVGDSESIPHPLYISVTDERRRPILG
jgi:hypothetical protein